ncbi:MAG TPA: hypothetical protein VFU76_14580 [Terriglobales bacterium]|nr:hypothetical protein [Terriglobales bacterium]
MIRSSEARFWQVVGLIAGMAGVATLGYVMYKFGLASINPVALHFGMAGAFVILAATACFVAGRALQVEETVLTPGESVLWAVLGIVAVVSGVAAVVVSFTQPSLFSVDRFSMQLAGAFAVMAGVICLLGHRVMVHMRGMYTGAEPVEKSRAASA